jgi:hypothetical protein
MRKRGPKAIGLCLLAALGAMTFATASAQAEKNSYWALLNAANTLVKVGVPNDTLLPSLEAGMAAEGADGVLLTKVAGIKVEILCTEIGLPNAETKLLLEGKILGRARFTGCATKLNGVTSTPCKPHTGTEKGVIITLKLKGLIELHILQPGEITDEIVMVLDDMEPFPNKDHFATLELDPECAIGSKISIFGRFAIQDQQFLSLLFDHLWQEFKALTHMYAISDTVEHAATIDGSAEVFLLGEHLGLKWEGAPG